MHAHTHPRDAAAGARGAGSGGWGSGWWGAGAGGGGGGRRALGDDHRYVGLCNDADGAWGHGRPRHPSFTVSPGCRMLGRVFLCRIRRERGDCVVLLDGMRGVPCSIRRERRDSLVVLEGARKHGASRQMRRAPAVNFHTALCKAAHACMGRTAHRNVMSNTQHPSAAQAQTLNLLRSHFRVLRAGSDEVSTGILGRRTAPFPSFLIACCVPHDFTPRS